MKKINTVSQALRHIKELKGDLAQTDSRMGECVCWVETQRKMPDAVWIREAKPTYSYSALAEKRAALVAELVALKTRLAKTNANTSIAVDGKTMSIQAAVFTMAELKAERAMLAQLHIEEREFKAATGVYDEHGRPVMETNRHVSALGMLDRDNAVEALERRITEINEIVEDANHRTALLE